MRRYKLRNGYGYKGYWKRRRLTLEEANERLHEYFPNMDILKYNKVSVPALVNCRDCGQQFHTSYRIGTYMYGRAAECERCKYIRLLSKYRELQKNTNLEVTGYYTGEDSVTRVDLKCKICDYEGTHLVTSLPISRGCPKCNHRKCTDIYKEKLNRVNCTYISRDSGDTTSITYVCNTCGKLDTKQSGALDNEGGPCSNCNPVSYTSIKNKSSEESYMLGKEVGKFIQEYMQRGEIKLIHLFCGGQTTSSKKRLTTLILCADCRSRVSSGRPKEHNKHLVKEYLTVLKNVKKLKDLLEEHNQVDSLPEGEVKIILEHINGWINNYEEIMNKYPNGDLGSVLENNPLYERCKEIFYPVMDKFGIERL